MQAGPPAPAPSRPPVCACAHAPPRAHVRVDATQPPPIFKFRIPMTDEEKLEYALLILAGLRKQLSEVRPFTDIPASNGLVSRIDEAIEILKG